MTDKQRKYWALREKQKMTLRQFLRELRRSPRRWTIETWPPACHAIRINCHLTPLAFVCARVTKRLYGVATEYEIEDADQAAKELGFDDKLATQLSRASDFSMRYQMDVATKKLRTLLLKATGLSK